jgi:hypothetical protein
MGKPKDRTAARLKIVQAANRHIVRARAPRHSLAAAMHGVRPEPTLLSQRHLQRAVCIARRNRLVSDDVMALAGFRGVR